MVRLQRRRMVSTMALLAATSVASSAAFAAASSPDRGSAHGHQHAHVHGVAKLGIALQNQTVSIALESPLDSLIGFEHPPGTPAQKAAVLALQAKMQAPHDLFRFDAAAGCVLSKSTAESAIFQPAAAGAGGDEHADLDANLEFRCTSPAKLTTLDIGLFVAYPRLKRLDVDVATDKGQFKRDLTSPQRTISLLK